MKKLCSEYWSYIIAIMIGGGISMSIEILQVYLPARHSLLTDLITNVLEKCYSVSLIQKRQSLPFSQAIIHTI